MEEVKKLLNITDLVYKYRIHEGGISLGANTNKAIAWFMYVIMETCKRRKLNRENYKDSFIEKECMKKSQKFF